MTDLVKRLQRLARIARKALDTGKIMSIWSADPETLDQAASALESLSAENAALKADGASWRETLRKEREAFLHCTHLKDEYRGRALAAESRNTTLLQQRNEAFERAAKLENTIQNYLDGNYGPSFATKRDTCPHGQFEWEGCGQCIDEYFAAAIRQLNDSTKGEVK